MISAEAILSAKNTFIVAQESLKDYLNDLFNSERIMQAEMALSDYQLHRQFLKDSEKKELDEQLRGMINGSYMPFKLESFLSDNVI